MLRDQYDTIVHETSVVDRLKKTELKKSGSPPWVLIKKVFDNEAKIFWLFPTQVHKNITIESQYDAS